MCRNVKIILSRKGFDSSSGGVPSPIFHDGTMISLPIPDRASMTAYKDIAGNTFASVGELVHDLAGIPQTHRAHLDPDISAHAILRPEGWRPLFGQVGAAEKHLENQGVGVGDVFLYFGLFRDVERSGDRWTYVRGSSPIHVVFGWLQVGERVAVSNWPDEATWAFQHPHFQRDSDPTNVLYVGAKHVGLPGLNSLSIPGAGLFPQFTPALQLTEPKRRRPSLWLLPQWFHPEGRGSVLTYHGDLSRWRMCESGATLDSGARGQEFVLDCNHYPEATDWLNEVLALTIP